MVNKSKNREQNMEFEGYLHTVLSDVDRRIEMPDSLSASKLMHKLDGIDYDVETSSKGKFTPRLFTWQSGVTYAAAFVLIVMLSSVLSRSNNIIKDNPDLKDNTPIASVSEESQPEPVSKAPAPEASEPEQPDQQPVVDQQAQSQLVEDEPVTESSEQSSEQADEQSQVESETSSSQATESSDSSEDTSAAESSSGSQASSEASASESSSKAENDGSRASSAGGSAVQEGFALPSSNSSDQVAVGGANKSIMLGENGSSTFTYRNNDATDPDKEGFPITVSVVDTATDELIYQVDIDALQTVEQFMVFENVVAFIGKSEKGITLKSYDVSDPTAPVAISTVSQAGNLVEARLYKNVVHILTFVENEDNLTRSEFVRLPNSTADSVCVITAVDLTSEASEQVAFAGINGDINLFNMNAYLKYTGEPSEDKETGEYVAHVRLDGMNIELKSIA